MKSTARSWIRAHALVPLALCLSLAMASLALGQDGKAALKNVRWQQGPSAASLGDFAEIRVPAGFVFAGGNDTRLIMESMGNPASGKELGFLAPSAGEWFLVFEFSEVGYVRDDERNSLDADALLNSIRSGTEAANKERAKRGWATLSIVGWDLPPRYNPDTHNLEWAVRGQSEGHFVVNHNTRLLGRRGVMKVTLVGDPSAIPQILPGFATLMGDFTFKSGHQYAEFTRGDKVAQYGLAALIVGGAGAAAVKGGLFKWIWKLLVVAGLGVAGFLKKLIGAKRTA